VSVLNQTGLSLRNKLIMINNNKKQYIKVRTCPTRDCMRQKIFQNYYKKRRTHMIVHVQNKQKQKQNNDTSLFDRIPLFAHTTN
jgi:hypothetical protein